jgi:hypothetical protein
MENEQYFDTPETAKFESLLEPAAIREVIDIVLSVLHWGLQQQRLLLIGLSELAVDEHHLSVSLCFSKKVEDLNMLSAQERDEVPRRMARLAWYLFAKVDQKYRLSATSVPSGFRHYIELENDF